MAVWEASVILPSKYGCVYRINRQEWGKKTQKLWGAQSLAVQYLTWAAHRQHLVAGSNISSDLPFQFVEWFSVKVFSFFLCYTSYPQRQQGSNLASSIKPATLCWHIGPHCCCVYYLWSLPDERDTEIHSDWRKDELSAWMDLQQCLVYRHEMKKLSKLSSSTCTVYL